MSRKDLMARALIELRALVADGLSFADAHEDVCVFLAFDQKQAKALAATYALESGKRL